MLSSSEYNRYIVSRGVSDLVPFLRLNNRFKRAEDAKMALEQMEGFELAGRQVSLLFSGHRSGHCCPYT